MNIFGTDLREDLSALREHWAEIDGVVALQNRLSEVEQRLSSAESMIDAVIDGKVKLGKKSQNFFGEYRFRFPKK